MRAAAGRPAGPRRGRAPPAATTPTCPPATAARCASSCATSSTPGATSAASSWPSPRVALIGTVVPERRGAQLRQLPAVRLLPVLIVDSVVLSRRIKRKVAERFPTDDAQDPRPRLVRHQPLDDDPPLALPEARRRRSAPTSEPVDRGLTRRTSRPAPNVASRGIQTPRPLRPDHLRDRLRQLAHPRQPGRGGRRARLRARRPRRRHHHLRHRRRLRRHPGRVRPRPRPGRPAPRPPTSCSPRSTGRPAPAGTTAACPASTSSRAATPRWSGCRPTTSTSTRRTATTRRCRSRRR